MKFISHSIGNYLANHKFGDWTYELDNSNQITLRYWLSEFGSLEEATSNSPTVMTPKDRGELQDALLKGVTGLKIKVAALKNRQESSDVGCKRANPARAYTFAGFL